MAGWTGFTDDDLRKMRQSSLTDESATANKANLRRQQLQQQKGKDVRSPRFNVNPEATSARETVTDRMNLSVKLSPHDGSKEENRQTAGPVTNSLHDGKTKETKRLHSEEAKSSTRDKSEDDKPESVTGSDGITVSPGLQSQSGSSDIKELDENEALSVELKNVQSFQQRQKVIEEANKRKRALLSKAIDDRRKMAKAEAEKLMKVQQELNHLDSLLTADITIIRDKIEAASLEYMEAQKRYEKAEKEFVTAKMDLFAKCETKEHLTEHLYTIIHQNEVRKAKKLVELMEKLAMEITPEEMELTIAAIPQLTNFTAVSTLHDPHHMKVNSAAESKKIDVVSVPSVGEITRSESAEQETKNALTTNSAADILRGNHITLEAASETADHCPESVPDVNISEFVDDGSLPQQQNGILQNHVASESNLNNHPDITNETTAVTTLGEVNIPQNCCQSTTSNEVQIETSSVGTLQELTLEQKTTLTQVMQPMLADTTLPISNSEKVDDTNSPEFRTPSITISAGKGWTLPFV